MNLMSSMRSELYKIRKCSFLLIHMVVPILATIVFLFYFMMYNDVSEINRFTLICDVTALIYPMLISIVIGINIGMEEKAGCFQNLFTVLSRRKALLGKFVVLYGFGILALFLLFGTFYFVLIITNRVEILAFSLILQTIVGLAFGNLIIYILHLYLNMRFGIGASLFWGVFESLQIIMYSNIELQGAFRYIPFSWGVNITHDILQGDVMTNIVQWIVIAMITILAIGLVIVWFQNWEGRKFSD